MSGSQISGCIPSYRIDLCLREHGQSGGASHSQCVAGSQRGTALSCCGRPSSQSLAAPQIWGSSAAQGCRKLCKRTLLSPPMRRPPQSAYSSGIAGVPGGCCRLASLVVLPGAQLSQRAVAARPGIAGSCSGRAAPANGRPQGAGRRPQPPWPARGRSTGAAA